MLAGHIDPKGCANNGDWATGSAGFTGRLSLNLTGFNGFKFEAIFIEVIDPLLASFDRALMQGEGEVAGEQLNEQLLVVFAHVAQ